MKHLAKLLLISCVFFVLMGMVRGEYRSKQSAVAEELHKLNPAHNDELSYIDFLTYRVLKNGSARVATLGSSVTKGVGASVPSTTWRARLQNEIRSTSRPLKHVTIANHGHSGYTSEMLLRPEVIESVLKSRPDLLILETSVINNYRQNVPLDVTKASLEELYRTFTQQIPGIEILFISPNPILKTNLSESGLNELGLTFADYNNLTKSVAAENGWHYFDTHDAILNEMTERNIAIEDMLHDKIHPNDLGYEMWFNQLYQNKMTQPKFGE
ncbi:SGNH/GDSL hydrolase family protein [Jeotgalibacillus salarius]|uniref:SGNH/GDSL hydrolase family protein n=1 Tax=Jeotgalibacillus salarius TaxID=546023 RepID=A0A4Y8LCE7_9BACL|nr:SGNH/GDSL hydrolase family protein [Jeotgalibacillus salarius]TFD99744.1 SGNH/GDSL hydrolase family protein [Jeotgalibacillus salarius]